MTTSKLIMSLAIANNVADQLLEHRALDPDQAQLLFDILVDALNSQSIDTLMELTRTGAGGFYE